MEGIDAYLSEVQRLIGSLPRGQLRGVVDRLLHTYDEGRQLFLLGNGGSASTCSHIVNDFQKCIYLAGGRTFRCMSLTDNVALITAWANDTSYDRVFAEQLRPWLNSGDLVICVSGSGNSPNVLRAAILARELGAYVIGLSGYRGGKLAGLVDEAIVIPSENMQRIEDLHMIVLHLLFRRMQDEIEARAGGQQG